MKKNFQKIVKFNHQKKKLIVQLNQLEPKIKKAIDFAYSRIFKFHAFKKKDIQYIDKYNNKIQYKNVPINQLGIYVPANLPYTY